MIEKGVRFVQFFNGAQQTGGEGVSSCDDHKQRFKGYGIHGPLPDKPTAGLLIDLKQRGLVENTLVV